VCVDSISKTIDRVATRADMGGDSGSEDTVRSICTSSLGNLPRAFDELVNTIDLLDLYDNSVFRIPPKLVASFVGRETTFLAPELPSWMEEALGQSPYSTVKLREYFKQAKPLPTS